MGKAYKWDLDYRHSGPFLRGNLQRCFSICYFRISSITKTDCCMERSVPALLSAYEEYLVTSQVIQRARLVSLVLSRCFGRT